MYLRATIVATTLILAMMGGTAGCAEVEKAVNKGGDTRCSEYVAQDSAKKHTTVTKMLEEEGRESTASDQNAVDLAVAAVNLMCEAQANPDTPIRDADLTGILVPK
ncbi:MULTISPECIES: hypothetical protein [Nocardia]|uniref:hypothetical protein n=1 Tax=Nocardia TaxID=1817 RepID=UPI001C4E6DCF|nr:MULTISPECIES: hypothetical protein [Nocardia]